MPSGKIEITTNGYSLSNVYPLVLRYKNKSCIPCAKTITRYYLCWCCFYTSTSLPAWTFFTMSIILMENGVCIRILIRIKMAMGNLLPHIPTAPPFFFKSKPNKRPCGMHRIRFCMWTNPVRFCCERSFPPRFLHSCCQRNNFFFWEPPRLISERCKALLSIFSKGCRNPFAPKHCYGFRPEPWNDCLEPFIVCLETCNYWLEPFDFRL